jgi:hypothetical protein
MQPLIELGIKNMSTQYSTQLDTPSGYNTFVGKLNTEYFSSTLYYKKLDDKINEIRKSIASTSLDHCQTETSSYFNQVRSKTTRSAFDSNDADVYAESCELPNISTNQNNNNNSSIKVKATNQPGSDNDTIESTHTDSDDALPPKFNLNVYGTREEPVVAKVIYDKKKSLLGQENDEFNTSATNRVNKDRNVRRSKSSIAWDLLIDENPVDTQVKFTQSPDEVKISRETQTSSIDSPKFENVVRYLLKDFLRIYSTVK